MLEELKGFSFPVTVTAGFEEVARDIAERTQRARTWMSSVFGFEPSLHVQVLGPEDWEESIVGHVPYSLPTVSEAGTMYLAATDSELFDDIVARILEHLDGDGRRHFEAVYGRPPIVRGFRDLLSIHELAHTYHMQAGFEIQPKWLMEVF